MDSTAESALQIEFSPIDGKDYGIVCFYLDGEEFDAENDAPTVAAVEIKARFEKEYLSGLLALQNELKAKYAAEMETAFRAAIADDAEEAGDNELAEIAKRYASTDEEDSLWYS